MRWSHFKWDDSPNDPPNNPPVPDDDTQQGNAQPAQNNAAQANDNRNVLRSVFSKYRFCIYEVETVTKYKYLGTVFDNKFRWDDNVVYVCM